jgi:hypothetical protein
MPVVGRFSVVLAFVNAPAVILPERPVFRDVLENVAMSMLVGTVPVDHAAGSPRFAFVASLVTVAIPSPN